MFPNAFYTWYLMAVLLTHGHPARFDRPVTSTMKLPVYPTSVIWPIDLQKNGGYQTVRQQTTITKPVILDTTQRSLIMTSSVNVQRQSVEEIDALYSGSTSKDGRSVSSAKLPNQFSDVHLKLDRHVGQDLANINIGISQDTFNCTQISDIQTSQSIEKSEKIPQIEVASENAECTLDEQITSDSNRTLLNITNSTGTVTNQSYLPPHRQEATETVLLSTNSRITEESTQNRAFFAKAADLPQNAQKDSNIQAPGFLLGDIVIPYCSDGSSCLGRCDEHSFPDLDTEGSIEANKDNTVIPANIMHKDSSLMLMFDSTKAPVNLSSRAYSTRCSQERSPNQCNCDRKCVIYGDCCPDVFTLCFDMNTSKEMESLIRISQNYSFTSSKQTSKIQDLRQNTSNSQIILDHLYANYGSCQIKDKIYYRQMMFVSRCPDARDSLLKQSCEQPDDINIPPVTAKLGSVAIAFKNMFCAECHGVLPEEYEAWTTVLICDPSLSSASWKTVMIYDIDILLKYKLCNLTFTDRAIECQRRSCIELEKLTPEEEQQLQVGVDNLVCTLLDAILCRSYYFKVDNYRNPHCRKCLQHEERRSREVRQARQTVTLAPNHSVFLCPSAPSRGYKTPPMGVFLLLDVSESHTYKRPFKRSDPLLNTKSDVVNCSLSEIFDPVSQACHTLLCPLGKTAKQGQCVVSKNPKPSSESPHQSSETTIKVYIWTYSEQLSCQLFTGKFLEAELPNIRIEHIYIHVYGLRKEFKQIIPESNNSRKQSLCEEQDWENPAQNHTAVEIKMILNVDTDLQTWRAVEKIAEHLFSTDYHVTILSSQDYGQFACAAGAELKHFSSFQIEEENGNLQARVNVQENELYFPLAYVAYKRSFVKVGNATKDLTESISVCETSKLFLKQGCYVISFILNDTLNISQIYRQYGEANVDVQGNQVYVCIQQRSEVVISSDANITIFDIVHWTMAGTSMLCLVVMLSLYYLFPELLTLPGKMTASLAATMLLTLVSISLTLMDLHDRYLCPVAAAVSHVLVLAQYGWMSAIAFNMAMTFGPKTLNWAKSLHDKTFLKYNMLVWGISLVLVLISVILDILHEGSAEDEGSNSCSNTTSVQAGSNRSNTFCSSLTNDDDFPRYGWPFCTWFSGPLWTRLAFIVIPYAVSFVSNIVCFTITLYGIHRSSKQVQKLGKSSHPRIQCIIYIKLSTAMGFTSVFGILKTSTHTSDALTYFYMSLILLQGTFLFFGFMTNKRLFSLLKSRFGTREKSLKSSTTVITRG